ALVRVGVVGRLADDVVVDVRVGLVVLRLVLGLGLLLGQVVVVELLVGGVGLVVGLLVVDRQHRRRRPRRHVPVALGLRQERRQRARQRVDLGGVQQRAVGEVGLLLAEQPLEPEQQRVAPAPLGRRHLVALRDLGQRRVDRAAARAARGQRRLGVLALVHEA